MFDKLLNKKHSSVSDSNQVAHPSSQSIDSGNPQHSYGAMGPGVHGPGNHQVRTQSGDLNPSYNTLEPSLTKLDVAGLPVNVYGMQQLTPVSRNGVPEVCISIHMHGRTGSAMKEESLVKEMYSHAMNSRMQIGSNARTRDLLMVTFDSRDHGHRNTNPQAQKSWKEADDPTIRVGVSFIGTPDFQKLLKTRAKNSGMDDSPPAVPSALRMLMQRVDPAQQPYREYGPVNPFFGKKICACMGADDHLVRVAYAQEFLENVALAPPGSPEASQSLQVYIQPKTGHKVTPETKSLCVDPLESIDTVLEDKWVFRISMSSLFRARSGLYFAILSVLLCVVSSIDAAAGRGSGAKAGVAGSGAQRGSVSKPHSSGTSDGDLSLSNPPEVSRRVLNIGGFIVNIYGLEYLAPIVDNTTPNITLLIHMHGRTRSAMMEEPLVKTYFAEVRSHMTADPAGSKNDFLIASFDGPNHGNRTTLPMAQSGYSSGNLQFVYVH
ncbi:hypothetical protein MPSI1_001933 [Malassezia psittaci]|uniref:Uncharacterized protein n=1 Tax=Malassezia psittaci TaxID=1821823 RepID=A0AAF0JDR1_9BASI|nr:hypothetical protein MPSI1_001933 [Malassezia psittaci]